MTVSELKTKLEKFDANLEIGGIGHFGELLSIEDIRISAFGKFVVIDIESAGPDPDADTM